MMDPKDQDQSIKERKKLLYEEDEVPPSAAGDGERLPFRVYLTRTPAAPLPVGTRALLWLAAAVVALLLLLTILRGAYPRKPARPGTPALKKSEIEGLRDQVRAVWGRAEADSPQRHNGHHG